MPTESDHSAIGPRLRELRHERGLSQRELSSPGVSYAYISRIEAGARRPSVKALRMLATKLGVTAEYLETGDLLTSTDALLADLRRRTADGEMTMHVDGDVVIEWKRPTDPKSARLVRPTLTEAVAAALAYEDEQVRIAAERERLERERVQAEERLLVEARAADDLLDGRTEC